MADDNKIEINPADAELALRLYRLAYRKQWNDTHKENIKKSNRKWVAKNKEHLANYIKEYRKLNREHINNKARVFNKKWRDAHPDQWKNINRENSRRWREQKKLLEKNNASS